MNKTKKSKGVCRKHSDFGNIVITWNDRQLVGCPYCATNELVEKLQNQLAILRGHLKSAREMCQDNGVEWCCMDEAFRNDPELQFLVDHDEWLAEFRDRLPASNVHVTEADVGGEVTYYDFHGVTHDKPNDLIERYLAEVVLEKTNRKARITEWGIGNNGHFTHKFVYRENA